MKNVLRSFFTTPCAYIFIITYVLISCTKELIYTAPSQQSQLLISTRGISNIPLPYIIYIFNKSNICTNQLIINNEEDISLPLDAGKYTLKAFANAKTNIWTFPDQTSATLNSLIIPKNDVLLSNLCAGSSSVELKQNEKISVDLSLIRKLSDLTIELNNIPLTATGVKVKISSLYTSLNLDGETFEGSNEFNIALEKLGIPGEWTVTNVPIFPSKDNQVNITISIIIGNKTNSYSYTTSAPQSNKQYYIKGSYTGEKENETRLNIHFDLLPWDSSITINKDFGKGTETNDNSNNEEDNNNPQEPINLPAIGSIWNNTCVMAIKNITNTSAELLLMSIDEWQGITPEEAFASASSYNVSNITEWRIPTITDVAELSKNRQEIGISLLNSTLKEAGGNGISANAYYLCSDNETYKKFRFSGTIADIGSTKQFRLRLIKNYTWNKDS